MMLLVALLCAVVVFWKVDATTVVAARCSNGIVIASDSQSISGGVISSRTVKKVFQLSKSTVICAAGNLPKSNTDFQQLYNSLRDTISTHEHHFETTLSTSAIVKVARQLINTEFNDAHVVIAGWNEEFRTEKHDEHKHCSDESEYVLCEILPGGSRFDLPVVVAGTGSTLIASLLEDSLQPSVEDISDSFEKKRTIPNTHSRYVTLTTQQTIPKLQRSLTLATRLDPHTGGDKFHMWVLSKPDKDKKNGGDIRNSVDSLVSGVESTVLNGA